MILQNNVVTCNKSLIIPWSSRLRTKIIRGAGYTLQAVLAKRELNVCTLLQKPPSENTWWNWSSRKFFKDTKCPKRVHFQRKCRTVLVFLFLFLCDGLRALRLGLVLESVDDCLEYEMYRRLVDTFHILCVSIVEGLFHGSQEGSLHSLQKRRTKDLNKNVMERRTYGSITFV